MEKLRDEIDYFTLFLHRNVGQPDAGLITAKTFWHQGHFTISKKVVGKVKT